jgi:large subunit ribosomal protein L23
MEAINKASKFAAGVLIAPHITEKAVNANQLNCYVFKVNPRSNRSMVKQAIKEVYNVIPKRVNITVIPSREVFVRRKKGVKAGYKKAVVFLKKGDKINIS